MKQPLLSILIMTAAAFISACATRPAKDPMSAAMVTHAELVKLATDESAAIRELRKSVAEAEKHLKQAEKQPQK